MNKLVALAQGALATLSDLQTFNIKNVEVKPTKTGNVGYRVTTDQGKVISFWQSNMDRVIEAIDEDNFRVIPGTSFAEDGGCIPRDAVSGGFWS